MLVLVERAKYDFVPHYNNIFYLSLSPQYSVLEEITTTDLLVQI